MSRHQGNGTIAQVTSMGLAIANQSIIANLFAIDMPAPPPKLVNL
jgi:hypothetical protein